MGANTSTMKGPAPGKPVAKRCPNGQIVPLSAQCPGTVKPIPTPIIITQEPQETGESEEIHASPQSKYCPGFVGLYPMNVKCPPTLQKYCPGYAMMFPGGTGCPLPMSSQEQEQEQEQSPTPYTGPVSIGTPYIGRDGFYNMIGCDPYPAPVKLQCPKEQSVTGGEYRYGRWDNNICPGQGVPLEKPVVMTFPIPPNTTDLNLLANGDPVPNVAKHYMLRYTCDKSNPTPSVQQPLPPVQYKNPVTLQPLAPPPAPVQYTKPVTIQPFAPPPAPTTSNMVRVESFGSNTFLTTNQLIMLFIIIIFIVMIVGAYKNNYIM